MGTIVVRGGRGVEGVGGREGVEVVRLKAAANLGIRHEQISKQVDGHLRPRVEVKRLTESIAGGLVRVNGHAEARPDIQSSLPRRHTWLEGHNGLIGGLRRVETVLVKLHVEVKTSVQPQDVLGALGIDLEGAFACPCRCSTSPC